MDNVSSNMGFSKRKGARIIMNDFEKLQEEFNDKINKLRETCPHTFVSEWIEEYWAIGHSTGYMIRTCNNCYKIIDRMTSCRTCHKEILEKDHIEGDGIKTPLGTWYCSEKCKKEDEKTMGL